jgi:hypothetical protein
MSWHAFCLMVAVFHQQYKEPFTETLSKGDNSGPSEPRCAPIVQERTRQCLDEMRNVIVTLRQNLDAYLTRFQTGRMLSSLNAQVISS